MIAWRAAVLGFDAGGAATLERDALLVVGPDAQGRAVVRAVGAYADLAVRFPGVRIDDWRPLVLAPAFVDLHVHYPQIDVIGSPADGLLPWLENYTFPHEARFADAAHAAAVASFFCDELDRHGVGTALTFATSHPESVDALMTEARRRGRRLITGKCLQDRHCPDGVRDHTPQSLRDTETLIARWHGVDRLGYAITPRFAPACSDAQLHGAGEIAAANPSVWVQSHVAENLDEIRWARELFPDARSYLDVYARAGLLRERSVYAHCIHFDDDDRALMRERGAAAAVCPTSNLFLGSGFFDFGAARRQGMLHGLASDVGGGTSLSPFATMRAAYDVGREGQTKQGLSLSPSALWHLHTWGAAQALGLGDRVGNLAPGFEADLIALDPSATPLLARRTAQADSLEEWLFAMIILADDRAVRRMVIDGRELQPATPT